MRGFRIPRRAARPALLAALLCWAAPCPAQEGKDKVEFTFSVAPDAPQVKSLALRPNVEQKWFVHATYRPAKENAKEKKVLIALAFVKRQGDKDVVKVFEPSKAEPTLKPNEAALVKFGPPPEAPKAAEEKAPPKEKEKGKAEAPALAELKGEGDLRLLALDEAGNVLGYQDLIPAKPSVYLDAALTPIVQPDGKSTLKAVITNHPGENYAYPPKVEAELVVDPARFPDLADTGRRDGDRSGRMGPATGKLTLTAENLVLKPAAVGTGWAYLTLDHYARAYIYKVTLDTLKKSDRAVPAESTTPLIRMSVPKVALPDKPLPVALEVDNIPASAWVEVSYGRMVEGKFQVENEEVHERRRDRAVKMLAGGSAADGALLLRPEVKDHAVEIDVGKTNGTRAVRVRLLQIDNEKPKAQSFTDAETGDLAGAADGEGPSIVKTVLLDSTKPEIKDVTVVLPRKPSGDAYLLPKKAALPLAVDAIDPDTGIAKVVFFLGKPVEGKLPPGVTPVEATQLLDGPVKGDGKAEPGRWVALLPAPTDRAGPVEVTVQVTNPVGLVEEKTIKIELVEGGPAAGPGGAKVGVIKGIVTVAGPAVRNEKGVVVGGGRPQPLSLVTLTVVREGPTGPNRFLVASERANERGEYIFKDVPPGIYRVDAVKKGDAATRGVNSVTIVEGMTGPAIVDINMTR
jgi:hypothetical protein